MVDGKVVFETLTEWHVLLCLICQQPAFACDILVHDRSDFANLCVVDTKRANATATLHKGKNCHLMRYTKAFFITLFATDECFINYDSLAFATHRNVKLACAHCFTNTVGKEPYRFNGDLKHPAKLVTGNASCCYTSNEWPVTTCEAGYDFFQKLCQCELCIACGNDHTCKGRDAQRFRVFLKAWSALRSAYRRCPYYHNVGKLDLLPIEHFLHVQMRHFHRKNVFWIVPTLYQPHLADTKIGILIGFVGYNNAKTKQIRTVFLFGR